MSNYKQNREVIVKLISIKKIIEGFLITVDVAFNQICVLYVYPVEIKQKTIPDELKKYVGKRINKKKQMINVWLKLTNAELSYYTVRADGEDWSCACGIKSGRKRITGLVKPKDKIESYHWYL